MKKGTYIWLLIAAGGAGMLIADITKSLIIPLFKHFIMGLPL